MTGILKNLGVREKVLLFILGIVILNFLFYFGFYEPQRERLALMNGELETVQQKITVVEDFISKHPDIAVYDAQLQAQLDQVDKKIPEDQSLSAFVKDVETAAKQSQIQLVNIDNSKTDAGGKDKKEKKNVQELSLNLKVRGNYFQLLEFLKQLESIERFTTVRAINSKLVNGVLESDLSVVVYCYGNSQKEKSAEKANPDKTTASDSK